MGGCLLSELILLPSELPLFQVTKTCTDWPEPERAVALFVAAGLREGTRT